MLKWSKSSRSYRMGQKRADEGLESLGLDNTPASLLGRLAVHHARKGQDLLTTVHELPVSESRSECPVDSL
jgi:hypothetical protein